MAMGHMTDVFRRGAEIDQRFARDACWRDRGRRRPAGGKGDQDIRHSLRTIRSRRFELLVEHVGVTVWAMSHAVTPSVCPQIADPLELRGG